MSKEPAIGSEGVPAPIQNYDYTCNGLVSPVTICKHVRGARAPGTSSTKKWNVVFYLGAAKGFPASTSVTLPSVEIQKCKEYAQLRTAGAQEAFRVVCCGYAYNALAILFQHLRSKGYELFNCGVGTSLLPLPESVRRLILVATLQCVASSSAVGKCCEHYRYEDCRHTLVDEGGFKYLLGQISFGDFDDAKGLLREKNRVFIKCISWEQLGKAIMKVDTELSRALTTAVEADRDVLKGELPYDPAAYFVRCTDPNHQTCRCDSYQTGRGPGEEEREREKERRRMRGAAGGGDGGKRDRADEYATGRYPVRILNSGDPYANCQFVVLNGSTASAPPSSSHTVILQPPGAAGPSPSVPFAAAGGSLPFQVYSYAPTPGYYQQPQTVDPNHGSEPIQQPQQQPQQQQQQQQYLPYATYAPGNPYAMPMHNANQMPMPMQMQMPSPQNQTQRQSQGMAPNGYMGHPYLHAGAPQYPGVNVQPYQSANAAPHAAQLNTAVHGNLNTRIHSSTSVSSHGGNGGGAGTSTPTYVSPTGSGAVHWSAAQSHAATAAGGSAQNHSGPPSQSLHPYPAGRHVPPHLQNAPPSHAPPPIAARGSPGFSQGPPYQTQSSAAGYPHVASADQRSGSPSVAGSASGSVAGGTYPHTNPNASSMYGGYAMSSGFSGYGHAGSGPRPPAEPYVMQPPGGQPLHPGGNTHSSQPYGPYASGSSQLQ